MRRWGDGTRWGSGARWPGKAPLPKRKNMSIATTNIGGLNVIQKLNKGANIIASSTDNPLVPGNAPMLAEVSTAQTALTTANAAVDAARDALKQCYIVRNTAETAWDEKVTLLAGFTEVATGGDAAGIISAGFGVRAGRTPTPALGAPENVLAKTNGSPGVTKLTWNPLPGATYYVVEQSPSPITANSWTQVATSTKASCETGGVEPGKEWWYRIAGGNASGDGPWSAPACRTVL